MNKSGTTDYQAQPSIQGFDENADKLFKFKSSAEFNQKIDFANANDPLLKQILPIIDETFDQPESFGNDPVGDEAAQKTPGLIHKYRSRVLLIATASCAVHCRYCFRRHFAYSNTVSKSKWLEQALDYIRQHTEINEVILSGGDPLMLNNQRLFNLINQIEAIPHIQTLRFHSRMIGVNNARFDSELMGFFGNIRLRKVFVSHINHPNELDLKSLQVFRQLNQAGFSCLNQAVLLKGVNDQPDTLINLCYKLHQQGALPYYLHLLDRVVGAAHFEVSEQQVQKIYRQICDQLPGYLVPRLVREEAGKKSKTLIAENT